jgi:hypothetical protein
MSSKAKSARAAGQKFVGKKEVRKDLTRYARQYLNPNEGTPKPLPSLSPFVGATRKFTRVHTLQSLGADTPFFVFQRPSLHNSYGFKVGAADVEVVRSIGWRQYESNPTGIESLAELFDRNGQVIGYSSPFPTNPGGWPTSLSVLEVTIGSTMSLAVSKFSQMDMFDLSGSLAYAINSGGEIAVWSVAAGTYYVVFYTVSPGGGIWCQDGANSMTVTGHGMSQFPMFEPHWIEDSKVSHYRIAAMSMLLTYTGNEYNNGGIIASARTRGVYGYEQDPYSTIVKLTRNQYHGALREGAYSFWIPGDLSELDFLGPGETPEAPTVLVAAGNFDDPNGSLELTLTYVVEFYSPLQIFEQRVFPAMTDDFTMTWHYLATLESSTCNPKHVEMIKGFLKKFGNAAGQFAGWLAKNPEVVAAAKAAIMALAAL